MPLSLALRTRVSLRVLAHLRETEQEAPARDGQPEHYLRHCLFSLERNPAQQHSISMQATEEFVGIQRFVLGFEREKKDLQRLQYGYQPQALAMPSSMISGSKSTF